MAREIKQQSVSSMGRSSLLASIVVGALVGMFGWLLTIAIHSWVLTPIFCRSSDTATACTNSGTTAWVIGFVLVSIIGLFMLIRANIFRPLLVVLAAIVTLWVFGLAFLSSVWWVGSFWSGVLFALAYALYTWVASAKQFAYALVGMIVLVVLFRVIISL